MFHEHDIPGLVDLFERRGVHLYHACQFEDFRSYLAVGGLPSRAQLEAQNRFMTPFTTDPIDHANAVWDKVFLNLEDSGKGFAHGHGVVPNPYGPVLLRFKPAVLTTATDVAVCLRTAGTPGFRRTLESLASAKEVDRLFYYPIDHAYGTAALKFKKGLQEEFGPAARSTEISCTFLHGLVPFDHLVDIVVDPYRFGERPLAAYVHQEIGLIGQQELKIRVKDRPTKIRRDTYQDLMTAVAFATPSLAKLSATTTSPWLQDWARRVERGSSLLRFNFQRFADYLRCGTIRSVAALQRDRQALAAKWEAEIAEEFAAEELLLWEEEFGLSDDERAMLVNEFEDDRDHWARSEDEGWFYADDEGDEAVAWNDDEDPDEEDA